ncbi:MAG: hypothetical protein QM743_08580 [Chitinophagaceae bacterium]
MIRKWHKYLLENYPLLWNMRLPSVLLVILLLHIFHYFIGYVHFNSSSDAYWENPAGLFFSSSFALFSIIGSFVVFILWLVRVFRNNPFKSFYPFSNGQLFSQFLILLLVSFLNITYYYSYTMGFVHHGLKGVNYANLKNGTKLYNRLVGLMNDSKESYGIEFRCGAYPFPLRKFVDPEKQGLNPEMLKPSDYFYEANDGRRFSSGQIDSMTGGVPYSYLNYCNNYPVLSVDVGDPREMYQTNIQEDVLSDPKQLRADMEAFVLLLDEEHIDHTITAEAWFNAVYHPPYFPVSQLIAQGRMRNAQGIPELSKGYYIDRYALERKFRIAQQVRRFRVEPGVLCGMLYAALGMSLLVFTFRATDRRVWLITIIGAALISLIVGAFSALIAFSGAAESLLAFYSFIIASFFVVYLLSTRKSWSGAALNWFTLSLPYLSLIILGWLATDRHSGKRDFEYWFREHATEYFYLFFIAYIIVVRLVLVPAYRRWQAMGE